MAWLNRLVWLLGSNQVTANIVIVGLANSGKSTIMHQLKPREVQMVHLDPTIPVCFHAEKFVSKNLTFIAFDLGDMDGFGNPWEDFYRDAHAIIFIFDSADRLMMPLVESQLHKMLLNPFVKDKNIPIVFLANKCDQCSAMPTLQIADMLHLKEAVKKTWNIFGSDALTGEGLNEAMDWLAHQLKRTRRSSV